MINIQDEEKRVSEGEMAKKLLEESSMELEEAEEE